MNVETSEWEKGFHFAATWGIERDMREGRRKALLWQIAHEVHQEKIYIFSLSINVQPERTQKTINLSPLSEDWARKFSFTLHTLHSIQWWWWMNWKKHFKVFFIAAVWINDEWMILIVERCMLLLLWRLTLEFPVYIKVVEMKGI